MVKLISITPDAERIIGYCARVSNPSNQDNPNVVKLLQYCIKHGHWSIFEMANAVFEIETSRAISAQILRHRSFSFQEFCVAGDTLIYFDLPRIFKDGKRQVFKRRIDHLYSMWSRKGGKKIVQKMNVRIFDEVSRTFKNAHIKNVFSTGMKEVFEVGLASGKTIRTTKEHKFLTKDGFVPLELAVGLQVRGNTATMSNPCFVATNGVDVYRDKEWLYGAKVRLGDVSLMAEEAGCSYHTIRKWLKKYGISFTRKEVADRHPIWNRGKFGYKSNLKHSKEHIDAIRRARSGSKSNWWKGGVERSFRQKVWDFTTSVAKEIHQNNSYVCQRCGAVGGKLHVHHVKSVAEYPHLAFDKSNLTTLCVACHRLIHRQSGEAKIWREKSRGNTLTVRWDKVVKIKSLGLQPTYDLEIDHMSHNYVANGIVVHNSQRYSKVQSVETVKPRRQDVKNRQNSLDDLSQEDLQWWEAETAKLYAQSQEIYNKALEKGIAKESARFVLPMASTSRLYMNGTIRSWIHYLKLRTGTDTQKEHRDIATAIQNILAEQLPTIADTLEWKKSES